LIKIIVADLDGTLLDSKKRVPENFPALIRELTKKGILFVPASGRAFYTLSKLFGPLSEQMGFICENGCALYYKCDLIRIAEIEKPELKRILDMVFALGDLYPGLCGLKGIYIQHRTPKFLEQVRRYFSQPIMMDSVYDAVDLDAFCKFSCIDQIDAETHGLPGLAALTDKYDLLPSGENWLDIAQKGENKGSALRLLMEKLGVSPDETMAFGDFVNDMSLMSACTHTYAMKNGHPDIIAAARHITEKTNDENGVIYTIAKELNLSL